MANHINLTSISEETLSTINKLYGCVLLQNAVSDKKAQLETAKKSLEKVTADMDSYKSALTASGTSEVDAISQAYEKFNLQKKDAETAIATFEDSISELRKEISANKKAAFAVVPDSLYDAYREGMDINKIEQNNAFLVATIEFLTNLGLGGKSETQIVKFAKSLTVWCGGGVKAVGKSAEKSWKEKTRNSFKEGVIRAFVAHGLAKKSFIWADDTLSAIRVTTPEDFEETTENKAE